MAGTGAGVPAWAEGLRADTGLRERLQLRWLDEPGERVEQREGLLEALRAAGAEGPLGEEALAITGRCVPLAVGLERVRRIARTPASLVLLHDPERPEHVFVALGPAMFPMFWVSAPPEPEALAAALQPYLREDRTQPGDLPRHWRAALSIQFEELQNLMAVVEHTMPWLDDGPWGSEYREDPLHGDPSTMGALAMFTVTRQLVEQGVGLFPSLTWRTLWSRSHVRIEQHPGGLWALDVRYRPAPHAEALRGLDEALGMGVPTDMPFDLVASLFRVGPVDEDDFEKLPLTGPQAAQRAALACVLWTGEPRAAQVLREVAEANRDDEEVLQTVGALANDYGYLGVLFELIRVAGDSPLGQGTRRALSPAQFGEG